MVPTKGKRARPECPKRCSGRDRVRVLLDGELEEIKKEIDEKNLAKLPLPEDQLLRCLYCGCVFIGSAGFSRALGYYRAPMIGMGWHPAKD
jgi:hypothetical protein